MGKNILSRWYRWKWSGIITVCSFALLAYGGVMYLNTTGEFYDGWSCELLIDYRDKDIITQAHPMYKELTIEEQERYDKIIDDDCSKFYNP